MTESVFGEYQTGRQRKHRSVCTCDGKVFNIYTGQPARGRRHIAGSGEADKGSTLDSLLRVGDTLLEVVRTARTVAAHGKVAMILPVPQQDLRTVTEALSVESAKNGPQASTISVSDCDRCCASVETPEFVGQRSTDTGSRRQSIIYVKIEL